VCCVSVVRVCAQDKEYGKSQDAHPDLKECFSMGPYNPKSGMPAPRLPAAPATFSASWLAYYKAMEVVWEPAPLH
jgi:hypothetical protein